MDIKCGAINRGLLFAGPPLPLLAGGAERGKICKKDGRRSKLCAGQQYFKIWEDSIAKTWFSMWKSCETIAWTWCYGEGAKRSQESRLSGRFSVLFFLCRRWPVFASERVNADNYKEVLRQHMVARGQRTCPDQKYAFWQFSANLHP